MKNFSFIYSDKTYNIGLTGELITGYKLLQTPAIV